MTPNDCKLNEALRALAIRNQPEAPPSLENTLRAEFRKRRNRKPVAVMLAAMGTIAAGLVALMLVPVTTELGPPTPHLAHIGAPALKAASQPVKVARKSRRAPARRELSATFYPLPGADALAPFEYGSVVRVQVPRSDLRVAGLPFNDDRIPESVQADVLVGQDGLARAVRFVQ